MTWQPSYCSLPELKAILFPAGQAPAVNVDSALQTSIDAASRAIDQATNRQFGSSETAVVRYYTYDGMIIDGLAAISIDDCQDTTGATVTYGSASGLASVAGRFWPYNAAADGKPYTHFLLSSGQAAFSSDAGAIAISAIWGWTTVPAPVVQACLIQAGRFYVRKDSLYGIAGSPDAGSEVRLLAKLDPDVALNIASVTRWWSVVSTGGKRVVHGWGGLQWL